MTKNVQIAPVEADEWWRPGGKHHCTRDPEAGPGTCWHWWEGCPKAEARGCYAVWHARKCLRANPNDQNAASFLRNMKVEP